jgi:hypothetical protein
MPCVRAQRDEARAAELDRSRNEATATWGIVRFTSERRAAHSHPEPLGLREDGLRYHRGAA